jgi:hypothetical protein
VRIAPLHVVEESDCLEKESLSAFPVTKPLESRPAKHRSAWNKALSDSLDCRSCTKRKATQIEMRKVQESDKLAQVARKNPARIEGFSVRLVAFSVRPEVGHDDPEALSCNACSMAELDPVHVRIGKEAVQQYDWTPVAKLVIGKSNPVRC